MAKEVFKKLEALLPEYEKDVKTIISFTVEDLSKLHPCNTFFRNPLVEEILKNAESNGYKFDSLEDQIAFEIANAFGTIDFVKEQIDFWKGRTREYIINYRVANGQSQYVIQQQMAADALETARKRIPTL